MTLESFRLLGLTLAQSALGRRRESRQALDALISRYSLNAAYQIAMVYARLGERDKAFEWLERAYAQHDTGPTLIQSDRIYFGKLRGDPRYAALLKKMNLPASP